ncbi:hypothetical protein [Reinekea sp. G2M2-21]|uniref:hypothetical protein n=1 Tax=Reinekea sp. G2M2-21 TaxID=2788942 RepID=UPI0018A8947A|nr:hypothetical protein [Reinekea sp. G2M2-21]
MIQLVRHSGVTPKVAGIKNRMIRFRFPIGLGAERDSTGPAFRRDPKGRGHKKPNDPIQISYWTWSGT